MTDEQYLTSFLIDDSIVIDAGSIGLAPLAVQKQVRHLFLSHTHADHIASLPLFLENVYEPTDDCVTVYGSEATFECLQRDVFNDRVWPDFIGLSTKYPPFLRLQPIGSGETVDVDGVRVTAIDVNHVVDTFGFLVESGGATVAIASDTGPTEELWREAAARDDLAALFLECSFPESLRWLADEAEHLTPSLYASEVRKIGRPVRSFAMHIKPSTRDTVLAELAEQGLAEVEVGDPGRVYEFPAS